MTPQNLQNVIKDDGYADQKSWYDNVYLKSKRWTKLRRRKLKEQDFKCNRCGAIKPLQVHHVDYKNVFDVTLSDLEVLCVPCHAKEHGSDFVYKEPDKGIVLSWD